MKKFMVVSKFNCFLLTYIFITMLCTACSKKGHDTNADGGPTDTGATGDSNSNDNLVDTNINSDDNNDSYTDGDTDSHTDGDTDSDTDTNIDTDTESGTIVNDTDSQTIDTADTDTSDITDSDIVTDSISDTHDSDTNNQTALIVVSEVSGDTTETGGVATFTVNLGTAPTADVVLSFASDNPAEGVTDLGTLTFMPTNWSIPQTVTIAGIDDHVADGDQTYTVFFDAAVSDDEMFSGITPPIVEVINIDDDTAGIQIQVSETDDYTTEDGIKATFTVVLTSEPISDVTIVLSSDNLNEGITDVTSLAFTSLDWNTTRTITVTGVDDTLIDGTIYYHIVFESAISDDPIYDGIIVESIDITNIDNEVTSIAVSDIDGNTSESGAQASFSVVLTIAPTADVTLSFASNNTEEGITTINTLTFTTVNWSAPQMVTVTGVDDLLVDGNQPYSIVFDPISSADPEFNGVVPPSVEITNIDDETAGFTVSHISGNTSEAGGQATFTVVLNSAPLNDVALEFASSDLEEGITDKNNLTFTTTNWASPQTITVTGVDDDLADGDQLYDIVFSQTVSEDSNYAVIIPRNVSVTNVDNDSAGFTVSAVSNNTSESGTQATFTIVLNTNPIDNVTVNFSSSNSLEGVTNTNSLTFTIMNWNAPQTVTVTGVDDTLMDGNQPYFINFGATVSDDSAYAALIPSPVSCLNVDNDTAGISVSKLSNATTESGITGIFTIVLNSAPRSNVTVNFASHNLQEGVTELTSVTFTPDNWFSPQTVTVTGVDDDWADGNQPYSIRFSATVSDDAAYAAITPPHVQASNLDNDTAGIGIREITGNTTEEGGTATFTVVLYSKPFSSVIVNFVSNDTGEGVTNVVSLTFTTVNWATPQTVTITGLDDDLADGDQPYTIVFSHTVSDDEAYAAITPLNIGVINEDDDSPGITVSEISGNTTEAGGIATFTVALSSEPYADVTVNFISDHINEGITDVTSLTFIPDEWDGTRTVTVTGVDDFRADGDHPYAIEFASTTSADPAYAAITPSNIVVINEEDDDSAGITVSQISGDTTEDGGTATFTVVLKSEPFYDVTVNFSSNNINEGITDVLSLTFTPYNWSDAQTVTVTGVDDGVVDGDQVYAIEFGETTSEDEEYAAITPEDVSVINLSSNRKYIFVSSWSQNGNYGNRLNADALCQSAGNDHLTEGTYIAILSDAWYFADGSGASDGAAGRIIDSDNNNRYVLPDGTLVASSKSDLFKGSISHAVSLDEHGDSHDDCVWTASSSSGAWGGADCFGWGWDSRWITDSGLYGLSNQSNATWLNTGNTLPCTDSCRIYCIEN